MTIVPPKRSEAEFGVRHTIGLSFHVRQSPWVFMPLQQQQEHGT